VSPLLIWLVGFGMVGRWLAGALDEQAGRHASRYGCSVRVVGLANARDGFVYDPNGLDLGSVRAAASSGRPVTEQRAARALPRAIDGLRATEADLLVEVTASPPADGEPGLTHMREALGRGIPVVTSNKWPVALHGAELAALARSQGAAFRAESTVMSGTPVLSALTEGLAGTVPVALRGVLNATANIILSKMADGTSYQDALAEAQRAGLAGRQVQRRVARVQVRRARRPVGQPPDDHRAEPGHHGPGMTPLRAGPRHPVRARSPAPAAARPRRGHP
jgi:homoserine dehydrogenase